MTVVERGGDAERDDDIAGVRVLEDVGGRQVGVLRATAGGENENESGYGHGESAHTWIVRLRRDAVKRR